MKNEESFAEAGLALTADRRANINKLSVQLRDICVGYEKYKASNNADQAEPDSDN